MRPKTAETRRTFKHSSAKYAQKDHFKVAPSNLRHFIYPKTMQLEPVIDYLE